MKQSPLPQSQLRQLIEQKQLPRAHQILVSRLQQQPQDDNAWYWLARVNVTAGDIAKAIKLLQKSLSITESPQYRGELAKLQCQSGEMMQARQTLANLTTSSVKDASLADTIANVYTRLAEYTTAHEWYLHAEILAEDNPDILFNSAVSHKIMGDIAGAIKRLKRVLQMQPGHFRAHYSLAELLEKADAAKHIADINAALETTQNAEAIRYLHHALALEYEKSGLFDAAFAHFSQSKHTLYAQLKFDAKRHHQFCLELIGHPPGPKTNINDESQRAEPVFVAGMPRSGTSLMEKLLCQSAYLAPLGELNDIALGIRNLAEGRPLDSMQLKLAAEKDLSEFSASYIRRMQALCTPVKRGCDKQPFNFYYIDFILSAMPKAKIILMLREKNDTCIANFRQLYNPQSPFHHYAYNLADIAAFYDDYVMLARHFAAKYPDNVKLQDYQELVKNGEAQMRQLYAFCALPWQADCLDFFKQSGACATASKLQIRRPLNSDSIGRWRDYAPFSPVLQEPS